MKKLTLLGVVGLLCLSLTAQENAMKPLTVGDKVPNITFSNLINYPTRIAKLSDFKGKLVILDLWSSSCISCIEAFPKMQKLQDEFKDQVQVILANPHTLTDDNINASFRVISLFERRTGVKLSLPIAFDDSILNQVFPHNSVPHIIVINQDGTVAGITSSIAINRNTITKILNGETNVLPLKNDWSFDYQQPLFIKSNGGDGNQFLERSLLTGYIDGAYSYLGWDKDPSGLCKRRYIINYPLRFIYKLAFPEVFKSFDNRIIIETDIPARFGLFRDTIPDVSLLYTYEAIMPPASPAVFEERLVADLQHCFHATAVREVRNVHCLVLRRQHGKDVLTALKGQSAKADTDRLTRNKFLQNQPMTVLVNLLNALLPLPVIDETGIIENISMRFPYNMHELDQEGWRSFLNTQGLILELSARPLEMAVIKNIYK